MSANWRQAIDDAIDEQMPLQGDSGREIEEAAREEKARALQTLARSRISVLVGPAGTGKTTMLRALCSRKELADNVLLLAPTGKARVQLGDKTGTKARTLAQFLRTAGRWEWERGYYLNPTGMRTGGFQTVIVDEASMLTEEMLAALLEALIDPQRVILCGDHRQLPPIGAGRPFADLVAHLRDQGGDDSGGGLGELTIGRRHRPTAADPTGARLRDDLSVAARFSSGPAPAGADQALARVVEGGGDGTVSVMSWADEDDLHSKIAQVLCADPDLGLSEGTPTASNDPSGRPANTKAMRRLPSAPAAMVRNGGRFSAQCAHGWVESPGSTGSSAGPGEGVTAHVLGRHVPFPTPSGPTRSCFTTRSCARTTSRVKQRTSGQVSTKAGKSPTAEIGMAVGWPTKSGRALGLWVEFSTQPGLQFTFWEDELNSRDEAIREVLEIAYAITVHKAQGSQFELTFLVIPNPCPLLSPELLYTALTRHRQRTMLLVQGDPLQLLSWETPPGLKPRAASPACSSRLIRSPRPTARCSTDPTSTGRRTMN